MGKIYNYIFNAGFGTGADHSKVYAVNWDKMPDEKPLKLTFSYTSNNTNDTFLETANIYCNLGQSYVIFGSGNSLINYRPDFLGFLTPIGFTVGATNFQSLTASTITNPPIYLDRRPYQNTITVEVKTSANQTASYTATLGNYTLILCFEELD